MKKLRLVILLVVMQTLSGKAYAGDFYFGLSAQTGNFWLSPLSGLALTKDLTYDWMTVKDENGKLELNDGNMFGFKARDLFRNFSLGATVGYQPIFSPFGVYANARYRFRQFRMQPNRSIDEMEKYKPSSIAVGIGIRITPFMVLLEEEGWSPMIEIGTNYNKVFACKAPFDNAKGQFGSGFSTRIALGIRTYKEEKSTIAGFVFCELPQYNYFNRDFELSDGTKPYENIKSKAYTVGIGLTLEL